MLKEDKLVCILKGKDLGIKILMGNFKNINKALEYFVVLSIMKILLQKLNKKYIDVYIYMYIYIYISVSFNLIYCILKLAL